MTLLVDLHVWTLRNQLLISDVDTGCFFYHEKNELGDASYLEEKALYTQSRDVTWSVSNKRPEKLKDALKEAEDLLNLHKCIKIHWISKTVVQLFLSNGTLITLTVSRHSGDVDRIFIDKSLCGQLSSELPTDVLLTNDFFLICYSDKPKLDYVRFSKRPAFESKKLEKLSSFDPKIFQADFPGPVNRRLTRKLAYSIHQDIVLAWALTNGHEAWPWSPMTTDWERANMALYAITGTTLEMLMFLKTDSDILDLSFQSAHLDQFMSVEQVTIGREEMKIDVCLYEFNRTKVQKVSVVTTQISSPVLCCAKSPSEEYLLLACEDSTLVMLDNSRKLVKKVVADLVPKFLSWHPSGVVIIVASSSGIIQLFDLALSKLAVQVSGEHTSPQTSLQLGTRFKSPVTVANLSWSLHDDHVDLVIAECSNLFLISLDKGPLVLLQLYLGTAGLGQLGPLSLVHQYLKLQQADKAIGILRALNWNTDGANAMQCLCAIFNSLQRMPLNADREVQLEAALATFYAPSKPLSDSALLQYREPIVQMARRFFHHLLRYARFEKAYLLAVDIDAKDLFLDLHYVARDRGEKLLADVAKRKACSEFGTSSGSEDAYDLDFDTSSEEGEGLMSDRTSNHSTESDLERTLKANSASKVEPGHGGSNSERASRTAVLHSTPGSGSPFKAPLRRHTFTAREMNRLDRTAAETVHERLSAQMFDKYPADLQRMLREASEVANTSPSQEGEMSSTFPVKIVRFGLF